MDEPLVAIIVINWNGRDDTIRCLDSISKVEYSNLIVYLVDNGSVDDTIARVRAEHPEVRIIANESNVGYCAAANIGIRDALDAGAQYVLPLNNDIIVSPDSVRSALDCYNDIPGVGAVAPRLLWLDDPSQVYSIGATLDFWFLVQLKRQPSGIVAKHVVERRRSIDASGIFMVSRDAINSSGLFDEQYFLYLEDFDYCMRIRDGGFSIVYEPTMVMWHKGSASLGGPHNPTAEYYNTRNRFILWRKNLGVMRAILVVYTYLSITVPIRTAFLITHDCGFVRTRAYIKGFLDGIRLYLAGSPRSICTTLH